MASATTSRACVPWPSSASWCSTPASPPTRAGSSPSTSSSCSPASSSPRLLLREVAKTGTDRPRRLLRPPGATDPAGRHRRDHRHRRRVVAVVEPARRAGRLRRRRVGGALRGQHPLRRRGDRLLHRDRRRRRRSSTSGRWRSRNNSISFWPFFLILSSLPHVGSPTSRCAGQAFILRVSADRDYHWFACCGQCSRRQRTPRGTAPSPPEASDDLAAGALLAVAARRVAS